MSRYTCGIYIIRNKKENKKYVGSTNGGRDRWKQHKEGLTKGTHHSRYLQRAWDKHGEDAFEFVFIEECIPEMLLIREQNWIDFFRSYDSRFGYNMSPTAGNTLGIKRSEETKKKLRELNLGEKHPMYGKHLSEEHKKKISESNMGRQISEETREKIRKRFAEGGHPFQGKHLTKEHKEKLRLIKVGKQLTEETKEKLRQAHLGKTYSEETNKKKARSNKECMNWKKVREIREKYASGNYTFIELGKEYDISAATAYSIVKQKSWKE